MYNIVLFFSLFESVIGFIAMSSSIMSFREPVKRRIIAAFFVMTSGIGILCYTVFTQGITSVDDFAIIFILTICSSWFLICSGDKFFVSIFNLITLMNIYIFTSYISYAFTLQYDYIKYIVLRGILRAFLYGSISFLMFKFIRNRVRRLIDTLDREWRMATLVPLVFLILQTFILYYPAPYWYWEGDNWYKYIILIVYLLFLTVYYLIYIQANGIVEKYALEKKQLLMTQQEKLWENELMRQKSVNELAFKQRHDMHHNNAVIMDMIKNGDIEELKNFVHKLDESLDKHTGDIFCPHPIINSIFNFYDKMGSNKGIKIKFIVNIPKKIGIDNVDITCILGNILENGVEGCMRLPEDTEKEIVFNAKFSDDRLLLQMENTCCHDIIFNNGLPLTQKKGGGIGVKSIIYTAENYGGTARFALVDGRFITQVVLNAVLIE